MSLDPNSSAGQNDSIYGALSDFYANAATTTSHGGTFPSVTDIAASLNYDELHRVAYLDRNNSANFKSGSANETIHLSAAVQREYSMRVKSKSEYYQDGASEHSSEAEYYRNLQLMHAGMLQGTFADGSL